MAQYLSSCYTSRDENNEEKEEKLCGNSTPPPQKRPYSRGNKSQLLGFSSNLSYFGLSTFIITFPLPWIYVWGGGLHGKTNDTLKSCLKGKRSLSRKLISNSIE